MNYFQRRLDLLIVFFFVVTLGNSVFGQNLELDSDDLVDGAFKVCYENSLNIKNITKDTYKSYTIDCVIVRTIEI